MQELASSLRREHRALDMLSYRLTTCRHLVACGESRFLQLAAADIVAAAQAANDAGSARTTMVRRTEVATDLPHGFIQLTRLCVESPEPFRGRFIDLRIQLAAAYDEIEELVSSTRRHANTALEEITSMYSLSEGATDTIRPQALSQSGRLSPAVLDPLVMSAQSVNLASAERGFHTVIDATNRIDLKSLASFLES